MNKRVWLSIAIILVLGLSVFLVLRETGEQPPPETLTPEMKKATGTPADHVPLLTQAQREQIALLDGEELVYRTINREVDRAELPQGSYGVRIALELGFIRQADDGAFLRLYDLGRPVIYVSGGDVNTVRFSDCTAQCSMEERSAEICFTTDISCALDAGTFTYPEKTYTLILTEADFGPLPEA